MLPTLLLSPGTNLNNTLTDKYQPPTQLLPSVLTYLRFDQDTNYWRHCKIEWNRCFGSGTQLKLDVDKSYCCGFYIYTFTMRNMFQSKCVTIFLLSSDDGNAHTNTGLVLPSFLSSPGRAIDTMSQSPISQLTTPVLAQHNPSYPHNTSHYTVLIFEINLRAAHYIKWKWELVNHNTDIHTDICNLTRC